MALSLYRKYPWRITTMNKKIKSIIFIVLAAAVIILGYFFCINSVVFADTAIAEEADAIETISDTENTLAEPSTGEDEQTPADDMEGAEGLAVDFVEWLKSEYGEDYERVKAVLERIIAADDRILKTPEPFIALGALSASSVDIKVRAWAKVEDYWAVYFDMNRVVYETFNKEGIGFPFPQLTVHQAKD